MKRLIALLLAFVIPFTTIGSVVAETLHLPEDLKDIEEETFGYTLSLDEVDVAFGTETIGSKAFVNSGLSKIYIPSTVSSIAPDAFEGTNVSIVTPDGTYAKAFADEHGFAWEDGSDHYGKDTLDAAQDLLEGEGLTGSLQMNGMGLVSTEGITDPQMLEKVESINRAIATYQEFVDQYNSDIGLLTEALGGLVDVISEVDLVADDDSVRIGIGGYDYTVYNESKESIGDDYEIVSMETSEDGNSVITELLSGGTTYYLSSNVSGTMISRSKNDVSSFGAPRTYAAARSTDGIVAAVEEILDRIEIFISTVSTQIELAKANALKTMDHLTEELASIVAGGTDGIENLYESLVKRFEDAQRLYRILEQIENVWKKFSIAGAVVSIFDDIRKLTTLDLLAKHGHPIPDIVTDAQRLEVIRMLNENILGAQIAYVADMVMSLADIVLEISSIVTWISSVVPGGLALALTVEALKKSVWFLVTAYVTQVVMAITADSQLKTAQNADDKLHSSVHGIVSDEETGDELQYVAITNGSLAVQTDQDGWYEIYLLPGNERLLFRAEGYEMKEIPVLLDVREETGINVELTPEDDSAALFGTVKSKDTGELLAGVQVLCGELETWTDETGYYSFEEIESGERTVSFYKAGYVRWEITLPLEEDQELELNAALDDCYIITNREELEAVANDVMGNYALGNSIDLGGEPWTPLPWFSGTLDGAGYSISGMQLTEGAPNENYAGLFVGLYGGHVFNLEMSSVNINMNAQGSMLGIGAICGGLNNGSTLTNCTVNGTISVTADNSNSSVYVGGLAGIGNNGSIIDSRSGMNVSVVTPNIGHAGGLAGLLDGGQAIDSYAGGSVTVVQNGRNSNASLNAFGTLYSSGTYVDACNAGGEVSAHSTNGFASAYGIVNANNSLNNAAVSASTEEGDATARGCYGGENSSNSAGILATATSGRSVAIGLHGVNGGQNTGSITARAVSGSAMARGGESVGSNVTNTGNVSAESVSGGSNAGGIYGQGSSSKNCSNSGSVTASGETEQALAIGMNSCAASENSGRVSATSSKGSAVGQGMTLCSDSTNYGDVDVTYKGEDDEEGGLSAHGLNTCTNSTNVGSVTGTVKASTTACTVSGTSGGSGNVNQGDVTATSSSGPANARGVRSSNSQNYGSVYAHTRAENTGDDLCNATAYGTDASGSFNGGDVTAIAENGGAHAYGHRGGSSSTGSVSAVSNFFETGTDEYGRDYGWVGVAHAYNSTSVQARVAGHSVSASGGNTVNLYYFFAASNCEDHMGMNRGFVSYEKGSEPDDFDGCFVHVGTADSDAN